jgi:hypothetical protein
LNQPELRLVPDEYRIELRVVADRGGGVDSRDDRAVPLGVRKPARDAWPIVLSTLTAVLGMAPLIFMPGLGAALLPVTVVILSGAHATAQDRPPSPVQVARAQVRELAPVVRAAGMVRSRASADPAVQVATGRRARHGKRVADPERNPAHRPARGGAVVIIGAR